MCGRSYDSIDDPYAQYCVPNKVKNINSKVFNLISEANETRFLVHHESCECKCRLNENVCNSKQKWNDDKCRCECNKVDDWGFCKKDCIWNTSAHDCDYNKAKKKKKKIDKYLSTKSCSCE